MPPPAAVQASIAAWHAPVAFWDAQAGGAERPHVEGALAPHILWRQGEGGRWHERSHAPAGECGAGPEHGAARRRVTRLEPYHGSDGRLAPRADLRGAAGALLPPAAPTRVRGHAWSRSTVRWRQPRPGRRSPGRAGRRGIFAGNALPDGAPTDRAGLRRAPVRRLHDLGDGRAILLGEQITPAGERVDIQLKGAGQHAVLARGDGRAALGPMLREYIISEAMHALGIPTTRSLAVVDDG